MSCLVNTFSMQDGIELYIQARNIFHQKLPMSAKLICHITKDKNWLVYWYSLSNNKQVSRSALDTNYFLVNDVNLICFQPFAKTDLILYYNTHDTPWKHQVVRHILRTPFVHIDSLYLCDDNMLYVLSYLQNYNTTKQVLLFLQRNEKIFSFSIFSNCIKKPETIIIVSEETMCLWSCISVSREFLCTCFLKSNCTHTRW